MVRSDAVDLTNCDREPIHIPGSIQPRGCLLSCGAGSVVVRRHSLNAAALLGIEGGDINGREVVDLIGQKASHELWNALARSKDPAKPGLILGLRIDDDRSAFDIAIHRHRGAIIMELEPVTDGHFGTPLEVVRALTARLRTTADSDELVANAARLVSGAFGYDRVMIYRFAHDGSGQVIAEAKRSDLDPFLGLHYPASDIPRQARELYLKNTIRIISNVDDETVPIEPSHDASGEPLDLSYAHLRSVSPIHCEYLRNMGVAGSMSISIIIGGKLWGLIACHHDTPRALSMAERTAAEMFGDFFSLHLEALLHKQKLEVATRSRKSLDGVLERVTRHGDFSTGLSENIGDFMGLVPCDGVGIWSGGTWRSHGSVPTESAVPDLARFVKSVADGNVWATHALCECLPAAADYHSQASGVLALPLSQIPGDYLMFFRKEIIQTVNWAGNPEMHLETGPQGDRLTPRKSFEIWTETVARQSIPWTEDDRDIANAARASLLEIILRQSELLADERRKSDVRQRILNEELNHRVKNILALIKSLVSQPIEDGKSLEDYAQSLMGRIKALAYAHDQVVRGDGGGALEELLKAELEPYRGTGDRIALQGAPVGLDSRAFSVMALVIHELATNAAKYGALSTVRGRVDVRWELTPEGSCEIVWQESGGPTVSTPAREGFGSILVNRSVPFDLGGESNVEYEPSGVRASFLLPSNVVWQKQQSEEPARAADVAATGSLEGISVLLVEDQLVIALDVQLMLAKNGADAVETAASAAEALRSLEASHPDVAVLDVNLGDGTSTPVAEELMRRNIPFVFATGYSDSQMIPKSMASVPVVRKPYDRDALTVALVEVLGREPAS